MTTIEHYKNLSFEDLRTLHREIGALIAQRRHEALEKLKQQISVLGFNVDDLIPKKPRNGAIKYRDNNGNTWGGKGKRPAWITAIVEGGGDIEEYRT